MSARNRRNHPRIAAAIALVVTAAAGPVLPAGALSLSEGSLPAGVDRLTHALEAVDEARGLLATDRLEDAVRAAASLADVELETSTLGSTSSAVTLPPGLARPVDRLVAAIERAGGLIKEAIPQDPRLRLTLGDAMRMGRLISRASASPPDQAALRSLRQWRRTARGLVDEPKLYSAALLVARAIDLSIPELEQVHLPYSEHAAVVGCDVVDQPVLCIGNSGANTYTSDRALVIDLGGDDVHTHSAGGATTALPVAITIDLGGNDRYERSDGIAQGAGNLGIGMLIDVAGSDTYSIAATKGSESAAGQGSNFSAGAGLLADFDGADSYLLSSTRDEGAFAAGQGRAAQPGFGILLDRGVGNDRYVTAARPMAPVQLEGEVKLGGLNANGVGFGGVGGVGILSDGGGTDEMTLETVSAPIAAEESRPVTQVPVVGPTGMGTGVLGTGLLLSGSGDTVRTTSVSMEAPRAGIATSNVFGRGLQGLGALIDEGGNDAYRATATVRATRRMIVNETCDCSDSQALATMSLPNVAAVSMSAMGVGTTGVGVLIDEAGNDEYVAVSQAIASAEVHDERSAGATGVSDATAIANGASLVAQGAGQGGIGLLQDDSGDDDYSTSVGSRASAVADAASPDAVTQAESKADFVMLTAQGASAATSGVPGFGLLRDRGGSDRYGSSSDSTATAFPETSAIVGQVSSSAQGSVTGTSVALLHDTDDGAVDVFVLTPEDPACSGTRGSDTWQDCGEGAGFGIVDDEHPATVIVPSRGGPSPSRAEPESARLEWGPR